MCVAHHNILISAAATVSTTPQFQTRTVIQANILIPVHKAAQIAMQAVLLAVETRVSV